MQDETKSKMFDAYALLFLLSHRFEYLTDKELAKDGLTTKQFLTIVTIGKAFGYPPSLKEVAAVLSTSHQNVKQIALQLVKKGFVKIEEDEQDKRKLVLKLTQKNKEYWDFAARRHEAIIRSMFNALNDKEIQVFYNLISKLLASTDIVYKEARKTTV
jgi:DNA-binding MarR family transcriptional regulator